MWLAMGCCTVHSGQREITDLFHRGDCAGVSSVRCVDSDCCDSIPRGSHRLSVPSPDSPVVRCSVKIITAITMRVFSSRKSKSASLAKLKARLWDFSAKKVRVVYSAMRQDLRVPPALTNCRSLLPPRRRSRQSPHQLRW